jgi:hypothetical protein
MKKLLYTSVGILLALGFSYPTFSAWSCKIENAPIKELVAYSKAVDTELDRLRKEATNKTNCGIAPGGAAANAERSLSILDGSFLSIPSFDTTFLDFSYNVKTAMNGETRAAVSRDGLLFNQIEKKITWALSVATNQCNLSPSIKSGFTTLLQQNNTLENIFKQAVLGTPWAPVNLSEANTLVAEAINVEYIPTATESCKDQNGTQDAIATLQQKIEKVWFGSESGIAEWKKAIALFQGGSAGGTSIEEKNNLQRKLLQEELARQGFSPRAAGAMLANFDCVKKEVKWDNSVEAMVKAKAACVSNPIKWLENITLLPLRQKVDAAKTIPERINAVNALSDTEKVVKDIAVTLNMLESLKTPAIDTKTDLMSNLIDIHLGLISTTESVNKRLPIMYKNCMKAQPWVPCPKP